MNTNNVTVMLIYAARPQIRFLGNATAPVKGVVHQSINLSYAIDNAIPDVVPAGISWTFRRGVDISIISEQSDSRYKFSSDRCLMISSLTLEDEGDYTIMATNKAGSDDYTVTVVVEGKCNYIHTPCCDLPMFLLNLKFSVLF